MSGPDILDELRSPGGEEALRATCEMAVDADPQRRAEGQRRLFVEVAERLGDAFEPEGVALYDRLFAGVIDFCRHRPEVSAVDALLTRFGATTRGDLGRRKARLLSTPPLTDHRRRAVRKVFVLSRVTLGADVAVTSLVLQKLERVLPVAERLLVGPPALAALFEGAPGVRLLPQPYDRRGGLIGRLESWVQLVAALDRERAGLRADECLVVDPDSRLSQLGLLPVAEDDVPTLFFESRSYGGRGQETLGALTARWLEEVLGSDPAAALWPGVWPEEKLKMAGARTISALRGGGPRVVAVNLGVGDNPRKRLPGDFELRLLRALRAEGVRLVVDTGIGEERARVGAVVAALQGDGAAVARITDHDLGTPPATLPDVLAYEGGVGGFAALAGASDLYVGYDSAFQHVAAAQAVPVVDIFVDAPSPLFAARWRPHSRAAVAVVKPAAEEAVASVVTACRRLLS